MNYAFTMKAVCQFGSICKQQQSNHSKPKKRNWKTKEKKNHAVKQEWFGTKEY